ncbi:MAG TPA: tRNA (adenosine(37)-N6)-threonylcarbamoyltransferase complex ATPase subunit type 1 TsaE [Candidatus Paceibacterota bacterium]|jgi:tRNA threonylcarbamoyladenosine biosynthesis protein TsaE|nr:tRNA (adenosine(37)-N6)-threonylcarbamoyltransferase complex ATPase subunit type 1 TsaE [Parcubacteria group bacterium]MDP6119543.1 tRNA (adenosine(37)-N6)-threonylcarbamoyltransferase complex ATPase subunit type 1 TsaE [Candidatus Paceibacterota bacterium]HJN63011.1 tRNA (adenosine(37)-N6)-threonylcarbamoyltransferase complex ATPase subunit type 1 TsaE [Candidatus Paceibacterota bacterium]|tara:strand:- start:1171 stop:1602 length:432 start_codon:yes stop_codon:yes gene_type:complete
MRAISKSVEETNKLAGEILNTIKKSDKAIIFGLRGDLGSGKTTFVKAIAEHLGLKQTLTSPTFVIEKIYKLENKNFNHLIHIDAYRLEKGEELKTLGWEEISSDPNNLIFIEWPENVSDILPENTKYINFEFIDDKIREISYE